MTFTKIEDPTEHLDNYWAHMDLHRTPLEGACRAFPLTLSESAQDRFKKLPPKSINSFDDSVRKFLVQFLVKRIQKKSTGHLMSMCQQDDESLRDYIIRFNQAKSSIEATTDEMVYVALYQRLKLEGPLMADLARREPKNLLEFMDKVDEYINQEETLQTMISSQKAQALVPQNSNKKKNNQQ